MTATIDNEVYNRIADTWWSDDSFASLLRTALNPARFGYFQRVLADKLHIDARGKHALDVGCGGGLLAEEFARLGCRVTGIDPSEPSVEAARTHAWETGLDIDYRVGVGERLSFEDASFDIVYCCDVLEHVNDLDQVIAEIARVLKPSGVFLYDTINRTLVSKLVFIKLYQDWGWTSFFPPNVHIWDMFIRPEELRGHLTRHGIEPREVVGMGPGINPIKLLRLLRAAKQGTISYAELGRRANIQESKDISVSYMGYGIRDDRGRKRI